jgi:hypothetical protein
MSGHFIDKIISNSLTKLLLLKYSVILIMHNKLNGQ